MRSEKNGEAGPEARGGRLGAIGLPALGAQGLSSDRRERIVSTLPKSSPRPGIAAPAAARARRYSSAGRLPPIARLPAPRRVEGESQARLPSLHAGRACFEAQATTTASERDGSDRPRDGHATRRAVGDGLHARHAGWLDVDASSPSSTCSLESAWPWLPDGPSAAARSLHSLERLVESAVTFLRPSASTMGRSSRRRTSTTGPTGTGFD